MTPDEKTDLKLNIGKIPEILLDNTDRNRTSPFAFTGNKFELRAVGSSTNCASAMIPLNTIVANQLVEFKKETDKIIKSGIKKDEAIFQVLRNYITSSKKIRFEGNNYSEEWVKEAEKRGLPNIKSTPLALDAFTAKKNIELYEKNGILNEVELYARRELKLEKYTMKVQIESRIIGELALNQIIPTAIKYQNTLIENVKGLIEIGSVKLSKVKAAAISTTKGEEGMDKAGYVDQVNGNGYIPDGSSAYTQTETIDEISMHITAIKAYTDQMINERKRVNAFEDAREKAIAYCDNVKPYFEKIRNHVDKLELIVDDELWPLVKYRELLFTK